MLLAAIVATALAGQPLHLRNVHHLVTVAMKKSARAQYGFRWTETTGGVRVRRTVSYRQFTYLFQRLEDVLGALQGGTPPDQRDYPAGDLPDLASALSIVQEAGPFKPGEATEVRLARATIDTENQVRVKLLQGVSDAILEATLPARLLTGAAYAVDESAVRAWAKPRQDRASADLDARWGYKTATFGDPADKFFGYSLTALAPVRALDQPESRMPAVAARLALRPAANDNIEPALTGIQSLQAHGHQVKELIADRGYTYKKAQKWQTPLRELGIAPVLDLHPHDRGAHYDKETGAVWIDGWPYCAETPERLKKIPRPPSFSAGKPRPTTNTPATHPSHTTTATNTRALASAAKQERNHARNTEVAQALEKFHQLIAERGQYALRRVAGPDATGKERFEDPAHAGQLTCANCPISVHFVDVPVIDSAPDKNDPASPLICRQRTITAPGHIQAKLRQEHRWGTPDWINSYSRRNVVEGLFGTLKSPDGTQIRRGWSKLTGLVKHTILLTCVTAAMNMHAVADWLTTNYPADPHWLNHLDDHQATSATLDHQPHTRSGSGTDQAPANGPPPPAATSPASAN